ncbi:hypothetical protein [Candidatus Poriferisodalis sp.]|uniref:hypothetical protein n=1 Tax=Candidatus Poriferisodalis sp. TaxID=3101277 RepID=UPI003B520A25
MTAAMDALFAVGIPRSALVVWSVLITMVSIGSQIEVLRRYRRHVLRAKTELASLRQLLKEFKREVYADLARMQAEVDAHSVWSEASNRFLHHGLAAISQRNSSRGSTAQRACVAEHRDTHGRRTAAPTWRPIRQTSRAVHPRRDLCR